MTFLICDSSFLVLLSKLELLDLLIEVFENIAIPQSVFVESVDQGKESKKMDAFFIEKRIIDQKIIVEKIKDLTEKENLMKNFNLHDGESEAIVLYSEKKADLLGTDDYKTLKVCKILNITYFTTPLFIFLCYSKKKLSKTRSILKFKELHKFGWYKKDLISEFIDRIENSEV
jgi:predicted nucleic acid-binding protein